MESQEFLNGYEKVYGYKYTEKLSEILDEKKKEI